MKNYLAIDAHAFLAWLKTHDRDSDMTINNCAYCPLAMWLRKEYEVDDPYWAVQVTAKAVKLWDLDYQTPVWVKEFVTQVDNLPTKHVRWENAARFYNRVTVIHLTKAGNVTDLMESILKEEEKNYP